jgi:hypothetical protein
MTKEPAKTFNELRCTGCTCGQVSMSPTVYMLEACWCLIVLVIDWGTTSSARWFPALQEDADGWTPMHFAALAGWSEGIEVSSPGGCSR